MKIALKYPVPHDGGTVKEIVLRRPRAKDLIRMTKATRSGTELDGIVAYVASQADLPDDVIEELDAEDFKAVSEAAERFLGDMEAGQDQSQKS
jgi:hypothetical protein